ncbi:hypothetical protein B484DRAFT_436592 [Ochromonadaceae sp. CCMP2298]|nr:hypothetical protein B484DRAFT_436592 [Ochromonadaceae sp. CCMP2298]
MDADDGSTADPFINAEAEDDDDASGGTARTIDEEADANVGGDASASRALHPIMYDSEGDRVPDPGNFSKDDEDLQVIPRRRGQPLLYGGWCGVRMMDSAHEDHSTELEWQMRGSCSYPDRVKDALAAVNQEQDRSNDPSKMLSINKQCPYMRGNNAKVPAYVFNKESAKMEMTKMRALMKGRKISKPYSK